MAKNFFFTLLVLVMGLTHLTFSEAKNNWEAPEGEFDDCQAPPPDSFRVTVAGGDFITLEWVPAWNGATHTLVVFLKNENDNTWEPIDTFNNVPGSSFTYAGSTPPVTKYGFSIATRCNNGETSGENDFVTPPIGVILDLTIEGRFPNNPIPLSPCTSIKYENFSWVGFFVQKNIGAYLPFNYFEVTVEDDHPVVKRAVYGSQVVAGTDNYQYPQNPPPNNHIYYLFPPAKFKVFEILGENSYVDIGNITITLSVEAGEKTIKICQDNWPIWNSSYNYIPFGVNNGNGFRSIDETVYQNNDDKLVITNPFKEEVKINFPKDYFKKSPVSIRLWSVSTGTIALERFLDIGENSNAFSLPSNHLPSGSYFLQIENHQEIIVKQVVKID